MKMLKRALVLVAVLVLSACGGGGGSAGTPVLGSGAGTPTLGSGTGTGTGTTTTANSPSVVVSISSTNVTSSAPATVTATVLDGAGTAQSGKVVSFSTAGGLGSFNVASALTDANGVVSVKLSPAAATSNGADLVVAQTTVGTASVSGTIGFQVTSAVISPVGAPSIAIALSSTTVTAATPVTVTAVVKDAAGSVLPNQVVSFSSVGTLGTFTPATALTDASGTASVKLTPATTTTNGAALAVAQATIGATQVTATAGFSVTSPGATTSGTPSIALVLSNATVTASAPATATATVKDGSGNALSGQVVKFSTVDGLGSFSVASALTDVTGRASVILSAANATGSGADQVVASATVAGSALQASQGFQLTAASASIAVFTSDIATLGPYGQANLTVGVAGVSSGTSVSLTVTSACVAKSKATLTPTTATTTTGTATFTYRDNGCGATAAVDNLQVTIAGTSTSRALALGLTAPTVASITFGSATPPTIYLKGSGLTETSTLQFTVVDTAGNALPNQNVTLELLTAAGGLTLDGGTVAVTKQSDSLGNVTALINSGTIPTPVRVKATLSGGITTVSSGLSIAVGLPSQLNFSLSQGTRNIEGFDIDGTTNTYSIIASDRLANPVPTGTAINFIAEGGQVEPSKTTALVNGLARASANFISSSPRPADGRITVVAYALGEESFLDTNGNNVWDAGVDSQFQDLGSVFLSRNFVSYYDQAMDQLVPLQLPNTTSSSACVASSGLMMLDKTIPSVGGSTCDGTWGRAYVRRATETVLSTSAARPLWYPSLANVYSTYIAPGASTASCPAGLDTAGTSAQPITGYVDTTGAEVHGAPFYTARLYTLGFRTALYNQPASTTIPILVGDRNPVRLNPVAAGTTLAVSATEGLTVSLTGGSPVPSSLEATTAGISITFATGTLSGTVTLNVTSPSSLTTSVPFFVSTQAPPAGAVACP